MVFNQPIKLLIQMKLLQFCFISITIYKYEKDRDGDSL